MNEDRPTTIMMVGTLIAGLALVFMSFGCGDKTTNNVYGDGSSIDTNVTDVNAGGAGSNDQSENPDNSDNSDNSVDNSNSSTNTNTQ